MPYVPAKIASPFPVTRNSSLAPNFSPAPIHSTRQSRFEWREERRWGNWDPFLALATPLLWLEAEPGLCLDAECVIAPPAVIELWP